MKATDRAAGGVAFRLLQAHDWLRRIYSRRYRPGGLDLDDVKHIVVIKLCCLGDAVLAVPALRALKTRWPEAHVSVLCTPRSSPAFTDLPYVDELISLPVTGMGDVGAFFRSGWEALQAVTHLRRHRPELAVDLDLYFKMTPVLSYLTGAPIRAGFDTEGYRRGGLFTHAVPRERNKWEAECFLDIIRAIGGPADDTRLEFHIPPAVSNAADQILRAHGLEPGSRYVVVCPGSSKNWSSKQWPAARFAELIDWVSEKHQLPALLIGASFESQLCEEVASLCATKVENIAGQTSVSETAAVLARASVLVTNDTGPLHLATAVGTPVVAIFGPTNEKKWGPRGPRDITIFNENCECRPCYYLSYMPDCDHRRCLVEVPALSVIQAVDTLLSPG